jgi:tetratricopeptide (TPR) repeat protein
MLNYEYGAHRYVITQAAYLLGDKYCSSYYLTGAYPLYQANYLWDTTIDRTKWNNSDETTYYQGYANIAVSNLVMENALSATDATDAERHTVYAYAQALRAMAYYQLANFYADTYQASTASTKLCVPIITSSAVNAAYRQGTIQEVYDLILSDINEALPYLPDKGRNILLPGKSACYAFLARVYLTMMDYTKAEEYADKALAINGELYDWTAFYEANRSNIEKANVWTRATSPMGYDYVENYDFKHGDNYSAGAIISLPQWRSQTVEDGDAKFYANWKLRDYGGGTIYYYGMTTGYYNMGGCRVAEQYLIKAECEARKGNLSTAMDLLNKVRKTRILAEKYQPLSASTTAEAMKYICRTKFNELIGSIIPFADIRRLNAEGTYPYTLTRVRDGVEETLPGDSYLWTMVFPLGAISNPGGGTLQYNATK